MAADKAAPVGGTSSGPSPGRAQADAYPVRVAVLGAGIFATDAYTPVLKRLPHLLLPRFVWSRSQEAAQKLAGVFREWAADVEALWGEEGLEKVEQSEEVPCCAVVLPIQAQVAMVKRMLSAGKHVLQEKPLAASAEEALKMMEWYKELNLSPCASTSSSSSTSPQHHLRPFWGVAENFRLEPAFARGAEAVESLGKVVTASVCIELAISPTNKYYNSQWRRDPSFKGAFIADCAVHYIAGLREVVKRPITRVCAHATHMDSTLPPPDNLTASIVLGPQGEEAAKSGGESPGTGPTATLQVTFCAPSNKMMWRAVCTGGVVEVQRGMHQGKFGYLVTTTKPGADPETTFVDFGGIDAELCAFAHVVASRLSPGSECQGGGGSGAVEEEVERHVRLLSPLEALEDLLVVAACLESASRDGTSTEVHREEVLQLRPWFAVPH